MGGDLFMQNTGCTKVIVTTRCVTYRLPVNQSQATHVSISISDSSLYNLQFFKSYQSVVMATDNYTNHDLSAVPGIFRQVTGLRLT